MITKTIQYQNTFPSVVSLSFRDDIEKVFFSNDILNIMFKLIIIKGNYDIGIWALIFHLVITIIQRTIQKEVYYFICILGYTRVTL